MQYDLKHLPTPTEFTRTSHNYHAVNCATYATRLTKEQVKAIESTIMQYTIFTIVTTEVARCYAYEFLDECAERYRNNREAKRFIKRIEQKFDMWRKRMLTAFVVDDIPWVKAVTASSYDVMRPYTEKIESAVRDVVYRAGISDTKLYAMIATTEAVTLVANRTFVLGYKRLGVAMREANPIGAIKAIAALSEFVKRDKFRNAPKINWLEQSNVQDALSDYGRNIFSPETSARIKDIANDIYETINKK